MEKAIAWQKRGGYSLCAAVKKAPSAPLPMACALGRVTPESCWEYKSCGKRDILQASKLVGLQTELPHFHCSTICRCKSGSLSKSSTMPLVQTDALAASVGGAGCSKRKHPPQTICQQSAMMHCRKNCVPWSSCRSSLPVRFSSPKSRKALRKGLGQLPLAGGSAG